MNGSEILSSDNFTFLDLDSFFLTVFRTLWVENWDCLHQIYGKKIYGIAKAFFNATIQLLLYRIEWFVITLYVGSENQPDAENYE